MRTMRIAGPLSITTPVQDAILEGLSSEQDIVAAYEAGDIIGRGAAGVVRDALCCPDRLSRRPRQVRKCVERATGETAAIKIIDKGARQTSFALRREVEALRGVQVRVLLLLLLLPAMC